MDSSFKHTNKPFLFKMSIGGERLAYTVLSHYQETHGVAQGIPFVGARQDESKCSPMQSFINPTEFDPGVIQ